jgi:hypothetical protein
VEQKNASVNKKRTSIVVFVPADCSGVFGNLCPLFGRKVSRPRRTPQLPKLSRRAERGKFLGFLAGRDSHDADGVADYV